MSIQITSRSPCQPLKTLLCIATCYCFVLFCFVLFCIVLQLAFVFIVEVKMQHPFHIITLKQNKMHTESQMYKGGKRKQRKLAKKR